MKAFIFLLLILQAGVARAIVPGLDELRSLYVESATSKSAAGKLLKLLSDVDDKSAPLLVCYKGAAEMIQAKYVISPLNRIQRFNAGRKLVEAAVMRDPDGVEIRYLRFTIQTNLPRFLSYNEEIKADKDFLLVKLNKIEDEVLKQDILKYLSASKYCSDRDRAILKNCAGNGDNKMAGL